MLHKFKSWFSKNSYDEIEAPIQLPENFEAKFKLKVDSLSVGTLYCKNGEWTFKYDTEFINHKQEYNHIVGFPDMNKTYQSEDLWPFFKVRIPGLKQPAIQEIIKSENIDVSNEAVLLKRFGQKSIANPYQLVFV